MGSEGGGSDRRKGRGEGEGLVRLVYLGERRGKEIEAWREITRDEREEITLVRTGEGEKEADIC